MTSARIHRDNRRKLLRRGLGLGLGAQLAALGMFPRAEAQARQDQSLLGVTGRVAAAAVNVYAEPAFDGQRILKFSRDQLLPLLEEIFAPKGPLHNPLWYRIAEGYIHSGLIQRVAYLPPNAPLEIIPEGSLLAEITVPFTRCFYAPAGSGFQPLYRLYYQSTHWIRETIEDASGTMWYRLYDPKIDSEYYAVCSDLRPILPEQYAPIAREVPASEKRIQVNIEQQTLTAFEGAKAG
jgi:hypothetical protein